MEKAHLNRCGADHRSVWSVIRKLLIVAATTCILPAADAPNQKLVSKTERIGFPSGGTLRLARSSGIVTVEAWDRPDVEITTISSSDEVRTTAERHGNVVVITTSPRGQGLAVFDPECRIKAPADARLIADHDMGEVNVEGLTGDIQVTLHKGEILLQLPQDARYDIHAQSRFGNVSSEWPGSEQRSWWLLGHRSLNEDSQAAHKLNLKVGCGDIVILKTRAPAVNKGGG